MARNINPEEHNEKRNQIMDAAQRLIYTKGYQQMSIQDIQTELGISKGAFYHYYDSKAALLEALVDRMQNQALAFIQPIIAEPQLSAFEKLTQYFSTVANWKTAQKDYLLAILRGWYMDDNAIVRQKVVDSGMERISPIIGQIIQQGIREGVVHTQFPNQVSQVVLSLLFTMGERLALMMLALLDEPDLHARQTGLAQITEMVAAFTDALERALGAASGSIVIFDTNILKEWLEPESDTSQPPTMQPQHPHNEKEISE